MNQPALAATEQDFLAYDNSQDPGPAYPNILKLA